VTGELEHNVKYVNITFITQDKFEPGIEQYKHVLVNISRLRCVAIATQPVHRLQIGPIVHN